MIFSKNDNGFQSIQINSPIITYSIFHFRFLNIHKTTFFHVIVIKFWDKIAQGMFLKNVKIIRYTSFDKVIENRLINYKITNK